MNHRIQSAFIAVISFSAAATASGQSVAFGSSTSDGPRPGTIAVDVRSPVNESLTDAQILGVLDAANGGEVDQGKIAEAKGHAQAVKDFGKMMVEEHTAAKEKGRALAKELSLPFQPSSIATDLKARSESLVKELHRSNAASFDGVYIGSQVTLHQDVLELIDAHLAKDVHSPELKTFVGDVRRHVVHHLEAAKATMKSLTPKS